MKRLKQLIENLKGAELFGEESVLISSVSMDSRKVAPGSLFAAVKGITTDGHLFIDDAIKQGAVAVICSELPDKLNPGVVYVKVKDSALSLGTIASAFYNHPSESLNIIGITGTNGKTTIATLLYETFTQLGYKCGLISTIKYLTGDNQTAAPFTTPDSIMTNKLLKEMVDNGCEYCFMEVSSHAVSQKRISGLKFKGGIFTNITHDHLDYHNSFNDYLKAKQGFFTLIPENSFALTCRDDKNGFVVVQHTKAKVYTYGVKSIADFNCKILENSIDGLNIEIDGKNLWLRLTGSYNAANITAIYATAVILGLKEEEVLTTLSCLESVEGRFEKYRSDKSGITAIVDYAHTPDAVQNVLQTIKEINKDEGEIITVIGTGGNRDTFKRPLMAKIAASLSNKVILTSDNPRDESPEKIIKDMKKGLDNVLLKKTLSITNRKEAINTAVMLAKENDIILIAGKGHEKYQEIAGVKHPFDDMETARELIEKKF